MTLNSSFVNQLRTSARRLFELIDGFAQVHVLVVGDLTLDEFLTGQVERVSREAPVLILRHETTRQSTDVFDVTGAGDTVVTALALSLCAGASFWEAAVLGNLAASLVVRQFGTATTTPDEMKTALQALLEDANAQFP